MITKYFLLFILILVGLVWGVMKISENHRPLSGIKNSLVMQISSSAFAYGSTIPTTYTCNGDGVNPALQFSGAPSDTRSFALIMDDPDAPGTFVHWVIYNIPADKKNISENSKPPGIVARNGAGTNKYIGPCPPTGTHTYHFKLYALDIMIPSDTVIDKATLLTAMKGHIMEQAELIGKFSKN